MTRKSKLLCTALVLSGNSRRLEPAPGNGLEGTHGGNGKPVNGPPSVIKKPRPLLAIVTRAENPSSNHSNQGKPIIPGRALHDKEENAK